MTKSRVPETREEASKRLTAAIHAHLKANIDDAGACWSRDQVPVLVFQPHAEVHKFLLTLGWDGRAAVFGAEVERLTRHRDPLVKHWLTRPRDDGSAPLLIVAQLGVLLYNVVPGAGIVAEPGSRDHEWMS